MLPWIDEYFDVRLRGSSLKRELLAGVATFLSLSYIFAVNPMILADAGIDRSSVFFATAITSGVATILMGLWGRLPFALAPGMEINAYIAYYVVQTLGLTWQQALGAVFWSGVIFVLLTLTNLRRKIIDSIPERIKAGLSFSVGIFLCLIALKISGILVYSGLTFHGYGSVWTAPALALFVGLGIILILDRFGIFGSMLYSIVAVSLLCYFFGEQQAVGTLPGLNASSFKAFGQLDFSVILHPSALSVVLVLFLIDFYGSVAKLVGLARSTSIVSQGVVPRTKNALLVDGLATEAGSVLGTTNITVYVESGIGILLGGRTGITAIVCGILMLSCLAFQPWFGMLPLAATTGPLMYVGWKLFPVREELSSLTRYDLLITLLMGATVVLTFALEKAILAGFALFLIRQAWDKERPDPYLCVSASLLTIGVIVQEFNRI